MAEALAEANCSAALGEVPVGAVVAQNVGNRLRIIARAHNRVESEGKASRHAEMLAIEQASEAVGDWRLSNCILAVTLEPCPMCIGALRLARVPLIVFGSSDPRAGACGSLFDLSQDARLGPVPRVISGIMEKECGELLSGFFQKRRQAA
ncbi:MAG: nucleoside deaminase [Oligoflexia bacterium]|nr:nucleoside deaminase [Oligoflexia bacterium]